MKWTSEPPKEPGWYLWRPCEGRDYTVVCLERCFLTYANTIDLYVKYPKDSTGVQYVRHMGGEWAKQ